MRKGKCTVMVAPHPHARGRVIVRRFFRGKFIENGRSKQSICSNCPTEKCCPSTFGPAVQKIPARHIAAHSELLIFFHFPHHYSLSLSAASLNGLLLQL